MLDPKGFADILRDPNHEQWREAYDKLVAIMRSRLHGGRAWPRVRESPVRADRDLAGELAHEFWLRLMETPNLLNAAVVRGWGAIGWEVIRFLRTPTLESIEVSESRLKEHLNSKIRATLRHGDYRELRRNYWGISGHPERAATSDELDRAGREQPALPADWSPQRSKQDPPIVNVEVLAGHLNVVIGLAGAYCWIGDLCDICWRALTPALGTAIPHKRSSVEVDNVPAHDRFRDFELPVLLQRFFDNLDADTREFVRLAYGENASVRGIEQRTGAAKTTVNRKLKAFQAGFGEYLKANGYAQRDTDAIAAALRDILGS